MKASVALCTYNGEKFLVEQVDSILNQTKKIDEIIICDDGSTDSTISILNAYRDQYPGLFRIYINEENLRSVKNFEKAISLCQNEIIFLCDQDDVWAINKVQVMMQFFMDHPNIYVVATNGYGINDTSTELDVYSLWDVPKFFLENKIAVNYFKIIAFSGNIATGASMALRKEFFHEIQPFPVLDGFHHDEWIALNAAMANKFDFLQEKLFKYRIHSNQQVGDVFLNRNEKNKKLLVQSFDYSVSDKKFTSFKYILKRLSKSYKKNKRLAGTSVNPALVSKINQELVALYLAHQKEMKKLYPIKFRFLQFSDTILNKRKLN